MPNKTLVTTAQNILKGLIVQCTLEQQYVFRLMYGHNKPDHTLEQIIETMEDLHTLDHAITQCERTLKKCL